MSHIPSISRRSIPDLMAMKGKEKIVSLTAYTAPMAAILDAHVDILLVGDSLGMVLYGMDSTLPVSLEMMMAHGKAVASHSSRACVLIDMPFGSYQQSPQQAFANAAKLLQETGCQAVKLEGGMEMVETVAFLTERAIPVMAHIGLKPQHVHSMGGYRYQARNKQEAALCIKEAKAFEQAGAFALLLEGLKESVARDVTNAVSIPTIGIGASPACDGQVLVTEDMLGLHEKTPKFVKQYAAMREMVDNAAADYRSEVKDGTFPTLAHCFATDK